jgi:hypothetical protein
MVGFLRDFEISNNVVSVYGVQGKVYFIMRIARLAVGLGDVWVTLAKTSDVEYIKVSDTPYPPTEIVPRSSVYTFALLSRCL